MAKLLRVAGIAALLSVAAAEEHSSLRVAHGHRRKHHRRHHPAAAGVEQHQQQEQPHSQSEQFASIQKDLILAWKERAHLEQLQHTIDTEKALLGQQKKLVSQNSESVTDEERGQFKMMVSMLKGSKSMMTKVRLAAIKKVKDAMSSVMSIDEAAGSDMEENKRRIEAAKAEIARATAANAKDQQIKQRTQKVLAAAVQEAKYFQTMLLKKKAAVVEERRDQVANREVHAVLSVEPVAPEEALSVDSVQAVSETESAQKEEVTQEKSNKEQVVTERSSMAWQQNEEKSNKQQFVTEKTQQNEESSDKKAEASKEDSKDDHATEAKKDEWEQLDEERAKKQENSPDKVQQEEAPDEYAHIKKESILAAYQQAMSDVDA
jgi:hypothetical protein